jgi:hypothetical protein
MQDDWLFLILRFVALLCFVALLVPVCLRIGSSETRSVLYARIATAVLMGDMTYVQVYSAWVRIVDWTPDWGPMSVAVAAALTGLIGLWGFWPWRRG